MLLFMHASNNFQGQILTGLFIVIMHLNSEFYLLIFSLGLLWFKFTIVPKKVKFITSFFDM